MDQKQPSFIAENIADTRTAWGWSQKKLAHVVGVDQASISFWERGKIVPCGSAQMVLALLFGCSREMLHKQFTWVPVDTFINHAFRVALDSYQEPKRATTPKN